MNVILVSPGYPEEMPLFARGLARVGARVLGVGQQPERTLPDLARRNLVAYLQVDDLADEEAVLHRVGQWTSGLHINRVECLWRPAVGLAARMREVVGVIGVSPRQVRLFQDRDAITQELDRWHIRTPRRERTASLSHCREAAQRVGYPLIVKVEPESGSADSCRIESRNQLDRAAGLFRRAPEVIVEEVVDGETYSFDTISVEGEVLYHNICWYRPRPRVGRAVEWVSPQTIALRGVDAPELDAGKRMGKAVLRAIGYRTGFTHMKWTLKPDGQAVFREIAACPPEARAVELMNCSSDIDLFSGWAEATCRQRFSQVVRRRHNAAVIFKRARGAGRISRVEGVESLMARYGPHVVSVDLLPVGAPRRDWRRTPLSDGNVIVRHPDLETTLEIADRVATDIQMWAQ
jgi:hypothetical protein